MERKISIAEVKTGMYVSSLDRPWLDTPFMIQGFYVTSDEDILMLAKYCDYVVIDTSRSANCSQYVDSRSRYPTNERLEAYLQGGKRQVEYESAKTVTEEMPAAKSVFTVAMDSTIDMMKGFATGESLHVGELREAIDPVIESVIRNPDAMMWLLQIKGKSDYVYSRAMSNSVLSIAFGRHMGLPRRELRKLSLGVLLMDVGMSTVPSSALEKNGKLSDEEYESVKQHVENGVKMLAGTKDIGQEIINIVMTHHERFDGSGYPAALLGTQTPVYGRIAGIIDCYNAMISHRPYCEPMSQHKVLQQMYNWRNRMFQDELVEQFLQCLGVYPTGTLVELNTGEVAIVMSQNPVRRFKPRVMIVLDANKKPYADFTELDLDHQEDAADEEVVQIAAGLDPGAYDIDPAEYYL